MKKIFILFFILTSCGQQDTKVAPKKEYVPKDPALKIIREGQEIQTAEKNLNLEDVLKFETTEDLTNTVNTVCGNDRYDGEATSPEISIFSILPERVTDQAGEGSVTCSFRFALNYYGVKKTYQLLNRTISLDLNQLNMEYKPSTGLERTQNQDLNLFSVTATNPYPFPVRVAINNVLGNIKGGLIGRSLKGCYFGVPPQKFVNGTVTVAIKNTDLKVYTNMGRTIAELRPQGKLELAYMTWISITPHIVNGAGVVGPSFSVLNWTIATGLDYDLSTDFPNLVSYISGKENGVTNLKTFGIKFGGHKTKNSNRLPYFMPFVDNHSVVNNDVLAANIFNNPNCK